MEEKRKGRALQLPGGIAGAPRNGIKDIAPARRSGIINLPVIGA
jgi:hypothetical protein